MTTTQVEIAQFALEQVSADQWSAGPFMVAVVGGGPGLVAAGVTDYGLGMDAAVWTSRDGHTWQRVPHDTAVFGDGLAVEAAQSSQVIADLAAGPLGILGVGSSGRPGDYDAAAWLWPDGLDWRRASLDPEGMGGAGDQFMRSVVQTEAGAVAVGGASGAAAAWTTVDGVSWSRAAVVQATAGTRPEPAAMNDVALGGPGLIAVGWAGFEPSPAVWLSVDGSEWNPLPATSIGGDAPSSNSDDMAHSLGDLIWPTIGMAAVSASEHGIVAIGGSPSGPVVWTSLTGYEWRRHDAVFADDEVGKPAGQYDYLKRPTIVLLEDVTWIGDLLVAPGGYAFPPSGAAYPAFVTLWVSSDFGATWHVGGESTIEPSDSQFGRGVAAIAVLENQIVLVGADDRPTGAHPDYGWMTYVRTPAVWNADIAELP